jgi:NTP pyrophosphatase (non-canonical NTP hydrolase)
MKELQQLKDIENWENINDKPKHYLWEHELGWLDWYFELEIILKENKVTPQQYIEAASITESNDWDKIQYRLQSKLRILHALIGINTENGELQDQFKKHIFYGKELDKINLIEELGDLFWYIAILCDELEVPFEEIWKKNIEKLALRYKGKFTETKAENRDLESERKILEK